MRVVAVFRVSSERQGTDGTSLDSQARIYEEMALRNGWTTVGTFRGVESATQAATERRVLQQALACIRENPVDAIYVHEQSRLTRGDQLEVLMLMRELQERRIKIIVHGVVRDLGSIDERFMVGIQSLVDRAESERIKERMARGKRERARQGKRASGAVPYGYRSAPPGSPARGTLQVVPEEAVVVRKIFDLAAGGMGTKRVAATLNAQGIPSPRGLKWSGQTITRLLRCMAYFGACTNFVWVMNPVTRRSEYRPDNAGAMITPDAHEPIVTREVWEAVNGRVPLPKTLVPRMLTKLLTINGLPARGESDGPKRFYRPPRGTRGNPWLEVGRTDGIVWDAFSSLAAQPELVERLMEQASDGREQVLLGHEIDHVETQVARHRRRLDQFITMRADGELPKEVFLQKRDETEKAIKEGEAELARLRSRAVAVGGNQAARVVAALQALLVGRTKLTGQQRREILRSAVRRVDLVVERSAAKQSRNDKGWLQATEGDRWAIRSVSFRFALPPDGGDAARDGSSGPDPVRNARGANDGPQWPNDEGAEFGEEALAGSLVRRPYTQSRPARPGMRTRTGRAGPTGMSSSSS